MGVSDIMFGQARQLNKLFKKYAYSLNQQLPIALKNSRELVVPSIVLKDKLSVIKWKDIDSVSISDNSKGTIFVTVYGKVINYKKFKAGDSKCAKYLDSMYCIDNYVDQSLIFSERQYISLLSKNEGVRLSYSEKIRNKLRKALQRLNNTQVVEDYGFWSFKLPVVYNRKAKEIIFTNSKYNYRGKLVLTAKDLKKARKIAFNYVDDSSKIDSSKIVSFVVYYSFKNKTLTHNNVGSVFDDETLKILKQVQPGSVLVFDEIKIQLPFSEDIGNLAPVALIVK